MPGPASFSIDEVTPLQGKLGGVQGQAPSQNQAPQSFHIDSIPLSRSDQLPTLGGYQNPATQRPEFSNVLNRLAASAIPGATGAVGELFGGPAGGAVGTAAGQAVSGPIAEGRGLRSEDLSDALKAAGIYSGLSFAGKIPGLIKGAITARTASKASQAAQSVEEARQVATGGIPTPPNVESEQNVLKARLAPVKAEETAAWNKVTQHAQNNTKTIPVKTGETPSTLTLPNGQPAPPTPIFQNQDVEGAIPLSPKTLQFINDTKADLATSVGPLNPQMSQAARTLNQVSRDIITDGQTGVSYVPFDGAKQLRTDLGKAYSQQLTRSMAPGQKLGVPYGTAIGAGLRDTLGDDIEKGLTSWGNDAIKDYSAAVGASKTTVKASVFDKLVARNTDQVKGTLDVDSIINGLKQETSKDGPIFSAADRNKMVNFLQAAKNVSPAYQGAGNFRGSNFVLSGASLATGHAWSAAYFGAKAIAKSLLGNEPSYARVASQLVSAPASSSQAKILTTSFLKGMGSGVAVTLISPSGKPVPAHTDGQGSIVPDFQSQ